MGAMFFQNGVGIGPNAGWCGFTGSSNYVVRYSFRTPSQGAQDLTLSLTGIYYGSGAGQQPFGFRVSDNSCLWANARGLSPDSDMAYMSYAGAEGYGCTLRAEGLNLTPDTEYYIFVYLVGSGTEYYSGWNCTEPGIALSGSYSAPAGEISSISPLVSTGGSLSLIMSPGAGSWHRAEFSRMGESLALSSPFGSALSQLCPREWMSRDTGAESMEIDVSVQSYADSGCLQAVGAPCKASFVLRADNDMRPVIDREALSLRVINEGAEARFTELIAGVSRLAADFDSSRISLENCAGATIERFCLTWGARRAESADGSVETGVITGERELICSVIDSRGREGRLSLALSPLVYVPPSLRDIAAVRCDGEGTETGDGLFCMIKASAEFTPFEGKNTVSLSLRIKPSGGDWGEETALPGFESGRWSSQWASPALPGGDMEGESYVLRFILRDALGSESVYEHRLYDQRWALKFNAAGTALGIGMAPAADRALQLPDMWRLYTGQLVLSGRSFGYLSPDEAAGEAVEGQVYFQLTE